MALIMQGRPTNLHPPPGTLVQEVESDVWMVCDRIKEKFGERVYINVMDDGSKYCFAAMERCDDGEDRLIKKYAELTPAVLGDLDYLLHLDLKERIRLLELECEKYEREWREQEEERLYEEVGRPMWTELERANFITRPVSYPKTGVTGGKGSLAKS